MRLHDVEQEITPTLEEYIHEVYARHEGKPPPTVIVLDDAQFKKAFKTRDTKMGKKLGGYTIPTNTLYFRNRPGPLAVAHELEHWSQAQTVGPETYIEHLQSEKAFREYEAAAEAVAAREAHRLSG